MTARSIHSFSNPVILSIICSNPALIGHYIIMDLLLYIYTVNYSTEMKTDRPGWWADECKCFHTPEKQNKGKICLEMEFIQTIVLSAPASRCQDSTSHNASLKHKTADSSSLDSCSVLRFVSRISGSHFCPVCRSLDISPALDHNSSTLILYLCPIDLTTFSFT